MHEKENAANVLLVSFQACPRSIFKFKYEVKCKQFSPFAFLPFSSDESKYSLCSF
jgi:hypothetical protein